MGVSEKTVKDGIDRMTEGDVKRAARRAGKAKHKANAGILKKLVCWIHDFADMLTDYVDKRFTDVPWYTIAALAFAITYVINPFDIIPDAVILVGAVDDFCVMTIVISLCEVDIQRWREWRKEYDKKEKQQKEETLQSG
jgi:uncharacterized membrane protein YkvA (DUF1232 family)